MGKINFAITDDNTRLASEFLKSLVELDYVHVPYKGAAPALAAIMGGEAQFTVTDPVASLNAAMSGKVRVLAVTSAQRAKRLPEVPTAIESGVARYVVGTWGGLLAPAGTPAAVIAKLNADSRRALAEPDVIERLEAFGLEVSPGSPDDFARLVRDNAERWQKLIADRKLTFGQ